MIITAKIAQAQSYKNSDLPLDLKELKKSTRQLRKVEKKINRKSKKGDVVIDYFSELYDLTRQVLLDNGYNIINRSNYKFGTWYVISWSKPE